MAKKAEAAAENVAQSKTQTEKTWPRIYVGPSIPKGYFKSNMVFADGLTDVAKALVEKHPVLETLIVSTKDYVKASAEVSQKGSKLHSAYSKALEIKGE